MDYSLGVTKEGAVSVIPGIENSDVSPLENLRLAISPVVLCVRVTSNDFIEVC